jgi:hypothetical protein
MGIVISGGRAVQTRSTEYAALREAVSDVSRQVEDLGWIRLDGSGPGQGLDDTAERRADLIRRSRLYRKRSPLAKQAFRLLSHYVLGQGVTLRANNKPIIARVIDEMWENPVNRRAFTSHAAMVEALDTIWTDGGLFIVLFPDTGKGTLEMSTLDPLTITDVILDPDNWRIPRYYRAKRSALRYDFASGTYIQSADVGEFTYYQDWKYKPGAGDDRPASVEKGLVYHVAPDRRGKFGEPELAAGLDWLRAHREWVEDRATISKAAAAVAWKKKRKGPASDVASELERLKSSLARPVNNAWESNPPPASGSWVVENENSTLEWVKTDTGAGGAHNDERIIRMMFGASVGVMNHYFGDEAQANLATATAMELPMLKAYEAWQKFLTDVITDLLDFALEIAHGAGRIGPRDDTRRYTEAEVTSAAVAKSSSATQEAFAEGSDDHFYGAWKGGRASSGGHPAAGGGADGGKDTMALNTNEKGEWKPARVRDVHDPFYASVMEGVPTSKSPTVYMTGGGPASGKTRGLLENPETGIPGKGKAAHIDPDSAKAAIPEYQRGLKRGDKMAASHAHEESSHMAKAGVVKALANGHDVVYDSVGDSGIDKLSAKVAQMRAQGAKRIEAQYATVSVAEAIRRSDERAAKTGRFVPHAYIRQAHEDVSRTTQAAIQRGLFDKLDVWDTNASTAVRIASYTREKGLTIHDQKAWDLFRGIGEVREAADAPFRIDGRLVEAGGHHFYGAWHGGKAGAGGGPGGGLASLREQLRLAKPEHVTATLHYPGKTAGSRTFDLPYHEFSVTRTFRSRGELAREMERRGMPPDEARHFASMVPVATHA